MLCVFSVQKFIYRVIERLNAERTTSFVVALVACGAWTAHLALTN